MWRFWTVAVVVVVGVSAGAQTTVKANQGAPGNQGPWPVTLVSGVGDGGEEPVVTAPCATLRQRTTDAGTAVLTVPVGGGLASRIWIQVCNSQLNSGTSICICNADGQPTFSVGSAGDVLSTGDCATYNVGPVDAGIPWCICNANNIALNTAECAP